MEIRLIRPDEAELFQAFRLRGLKESPAAFAATIEEQETMSAEQVKNRFSCSDESFVFGAFDGQAAPAGMAGFYREPRVKYRHKGVLWGMYVEPDARRNGIGRALLEAIVARAGKMAGLEQIGLDVVTGMEAARSLYRAYGFRVFGMESRAMKQENSYFDVEHMVLFLV
jgi:ribosomal protein S18 acetylase RimI-like enzyme